MTDAKYSEKPSSNTEIPGWRVLFESDNLKLKDEGLAARLYEVETAIFERLEELSQPGAPRDEAELAAIRDASNCLRQLRVDLLKYPDWEHETKAGNASG